MQSGKDRYATDEVFTIVNGSLLFRVWRTGIVLHMLLQEILSYIYKWCNLCVEENWSYKYAYNFLMES